VAAPSYKGLKPASSLASSVGRANKKTNTQPELLLRSAIHALGGRFRLHKRSLPGLPDLIFSRARVAVFCDGDFWHGRDWNARKLRLSVGSNGAYWIAKIERNRTRDRQANAALKQLGWLPVRVWETDIKRDPRRVALWVMRLVERKRSKPTGSKRS
jgi:DNA mismatch endonuclease (patch repair protein)